VREKQALFAVLIASGAAYATHTYEYRTLVAIGVAVAVYVIVRVVIATIGRTRYWYRRGTRSAYYERCPNCQRSRYRVPGDLILKCHKCGWRSGVPGLRWFTRSVPINQLRRSIPMTYVIAFAVGGLLVWTGISGGLAGLPDNASTGSETPDPQATPTRTPNIGDELNYTKIHASIVNYTNQKRLENGVEVVVYSPMISKSATQHANTMANYDFIGHTSPDGETARERYSNVCTYSGSGYTHGENAGGAWYQKTFRAYGTSREVYLTDEDDIGRYLVNAWMRSEGHRKNMLNPAWTKIGIGIKVRADGEIFAVQAFC